MRSRVERKLEREEIVLQSDYDADDADLKEEIEAAREYAQSPAGRLENLDRKIDSMVAAKVDSGTYTDAQIDAVRAERSALAAEIKTDADAKFATEWTAEVTEARKAAWNTMVKAGKFGRPGSGAVNWKAMRLQEQAQGWTMDNLKKAAQMHKEG